MKERKEGQNGWRAKKGGTNGKLSVPGGQ